MSAPQSIETPEPINFIDLSEAEMDALIQRVQVAIRDDLALTSSDLQLILSALESLLYLQDRITDQAITLKKLRQLLGLVNSSEKLNHVVASNGKTDNADADHQGDESSSTASSTDTKPKNKPQKPKPKPPKKKPTVHIHKLTGLSKGDRCPDCGKGKLYKFQPASFIRITGNSPFTTHKHVMERLRCNACQGYHTATPDEAVLDDGEVGQRYGYSARAMMCLNKFYMGQPYYRQESLQHLLGESITASTLFDQCEYVANDLKPIMQALESLAGNAEVILLDDTRHLILNQKGGTQKPDRRTGHLKSRTGIYSSGVLARLETDEAIALFETNIGHAGEYLDRLLDGRDAQAPPVKLMSDALTSNQPKVPDKAIHGLCNVHARREFVALKDHFPEAVTFVLTAYQSVWFNDQQATEKALTPTERRDYHHERSLPILQSIQSWGQTQLDDELVEENSALGKAIRYFLNHYDGLKQFCFEVNMPIDNNAMEALLKIVIRNRKNAMFFKTQAGASIGDVITSVIATCHLNAINPYEYLILIQRHRAAVKDNPLAWLPWNYEQTLDALTLNTEG